MSTNDITKIITRYNAGNTTQHIATYYGISKTRVATILRDHGITIRRQGLTTEQVTEAATLYAAGQSLAQIGARFGVSHTTIAAELRKQRIQLRPRPGWC
ncbi:Transposase and inactivated derivatives, IS30 family [Mycobacteroides abscessus subsp. bolletii]|uniref:helix-turn-helix domain-containing protein n=1 Tax=Mycobacteroides abscessus TaxID=36809 RepID=UPI00092A690F|nr:helix-turn-helix domain-containing protein [Mycobacteroides abscessus]SIJ89493.1 Transposase and inactivated derivatives, IS30 family [Mycobacteroides abscessus subsp. bolletii]SLF81264.1 Transposase and inactivated derivatives, IS30 family [Mycobacteroides abscessus subsp. bolletii]